MVLSSNENLKAKVSRPNASYSQQIENFKSRLKQASPLVKQAGNYNRQTNERMTVEQSTEASRQGTVYTYTVPHEDPAYQKNSIVVGRDRMRSLPKYRI
jgi:hypothetical protein